MCHKMTNGKRCLSNYFTIMCQFADKLRHCAVSCGIDAKP